MQTSSTSTTPGFEGRCTSLVLAIRDLLAISQASGQNCIGIERFLVAEPVYDTFVEAMHFRVARLRQNDILHHRVGFNKTDIERSDVGAMVTDRLFDRLEELIAAAVKDGARLLAGGKRWTNPNLPEGHYFTPTLLVDVTPEVSSSSPLGLQLTLHVDGYRAAGGLCAGHDRDEV